MFLPAWIIIVNSTGTDYIPIAIGTAPAGKDSRGSEGAFITKGKLKRLALLNAKP